MEGVLKVADQDPFALGIDNKPADKHIGIDLHLQVGDGGGGGGGGGWGGGGAGRARALRHLFRVSRALRRRVVVLCQHAVPGKSEITWLRKVIIYRPERMEYLSEGEM